MAANLAWDYILNGSLIRGAYEAFNQPFAYSGVQNYPLGILFIVFMVMLYIQTRNIGFNFIVTLVLFAALFHWIPAIVQGIIVVVLALELAGIIYVWATKED